MAWVCQKSHCWLPLLAQWFGHDGKQWFTAIWWQSWWQNPSFSNTCDVVDDIARLLGLMEIFLCYWDVFNKPETTSLEARHNRLASNSNCTLCIDSSFQICSPQDPTFCGWLLLRRSGGIRKLRSWEGDVSSTTVEQPTLCCNIIW